MTEAQRYEDSRNEPPPCPRCRGTGEVPAVSIAIYNGAEKTGTTPDYRTCPACAGLGVKSAKGKEAK